CQAWGRRRRAGGDEDAERHRLHGRRQGERGLRKGRRRRQPQPGSPFNSSVKRLFKKILIANRGEIAIRVMRACRELGIATAAGYSDADREAIFVRYADEAHHIGPAAPADSYLQLEKIVKTAKDCGAEAIHPGYGFLSERPEFPEACTAAHITFIGPPASAM